MGVETLPARTLEHSEAAGAYTYSIESLRRDIEESARADEAWEQLHVAPPERAETRLRQYLEALDETWRETLDVARADGAPAEVLHRINAVYGAEVVHAWIRCGGDVGRLRANVMQRRLVEWQHAVQRLLLSAPESEAREFWIAYRDLFRSAGTEAAGAEEQRRAGILGPMGVAHALILRNGWEAAPPEDPEDDQRLAVDLVARTPQGTLVMQIETVGAPGTLAWESVSTDPAQPPAWPKSRDLHRNLPVYLKKHQLDPDHVRAMSIRIPARALDPDTGMPDGATAGRLSAAARALLREGHA